MEPRKRARLLVFDGSGRWWWWTTTTAVENEQRPCFVFLLQLVGYWWWLKDGEGGDRKQTRHAARSFAFCRQMGGCLKEGRSLWTGKGRTQPNTTSQPKRARSSCLVITEGSRLVARKGTNTKGAPIRACLSCSLGGGLLIE